MSSAFFVHITDLHLDREKAWHALDRFISQVNSMNPKPEFVVNTGDTIFGDMQLTMDPADAKRDFQRYLRSVSRLSVPVHHVLGNHDVVRSDGTPGTPEYTKEMYLDLVAPRYYSFDALGIHFVAVDTWIHTKEKNTPENAPFTMDGIDDQQIQWIRDDLSKCTVGQRVCILSHRRVNFYPSVWNKIQPLLRDDLSFVNVAGCDHRNSRWTDGTFTTVITGAFCGGWWDGPCIDTSPPGYALIVPDDNGAMRHYYRPVDGSLAVASPHWSQIARDVIETDVVDPTTGFRCTATVDVQGRPAGWTEVEVRAGEHADNISMFKTPDENTLPGCAGEGSLEFEMLHNGDGDLTVQCNGREIGRYEDGGKIDGRCELTVPKGVLRQWNTITFTGDAILRLPVLVYRGAKYRDIRDTRLESVKPDWFREYRVPQWDISRKRPQSSTLFTGSEFFFCVE